MLFRQLPVTVIIFLTLIIQQHNQENIVVHFYVSSSLFSQLSSLLSTLFLSIHSPLFSSIHSFLFSLDLSQSLKAQQKR